MVSIFDCYVSKFKFFNVWANTYVVFVFFATPLRFLFMPNHQSTADVPLCMTIFSSTGHDGWSKRGSDKVMWIMDKVFKWTNFGVVSWLHDDFFILAVRTHAGLISWYCFHQLWCTTEKRLFLHVTRAKTTETKHWTNSKHTWRRFSCRKSGVV